MSYDALVWLLVGLGVGVAGSLMLLMGYAGLERARLGRRLRKARAAVAIAPEPKPAPVARPPGSRLDMARPAVAKPALDETRPEPVRPALVVVAATTPEPIVAAVPMAKVAEAEVAPAVTPPTPQPAAAAAPKPVQSVEALFAEAFANDKLPAPEPDEKSR